jgi:hypothetical protein
MFSADSFQRKIDSLDNADRRSTLRRINASTSTRHLVAVATPPLQHSHPHPPVDSYTRVPMFSFARRTQNTCSQQLISDLVSEVLRNQQY